MLFEVKNRWENEALDNTKNGDGYRCCAINNRSELDRWNEGKDREEKPWLSRAMTLWPGTSKDGGLLPEDFDLQ